MKRTATRIPDSEVVLRAIVEAEQELKAATEQLEHHSIRVRELAARVTLLSSRMAVLQNAVGATLSPEEQAEVDALLQNAG